MNERERAEIHVCCKSRQLLNPIMLCTCAISIEGIVVRRQEEGAACMGPCIMNRSVVIALFQSSYGVVDPHTGMCD